MKYLLSIFIVLATLQGFCAQAEVVVVGSKGISGTLSASDVKNLFLGKRNTLPDGSQVTIIEQKEGSSIKEEFHKKYTKKTSSQLKAYWSRLTFTGQGTPPKEVSSSSDVLALLAEQSNVIGYVDSSEVTGDVVVLTK